jgi:type I restriction enzyme R subunit
VAFGSQQGVDLVSLQNTTAAGFERLEQMLAAVNAFISPDAVRSAFFGHQKRLQTLYKAIKPDPAALAHSPLVACLNSLAETINAHLNPQPKPITEVIADIAELLDDSIKGHRIAETDVAPLDLSKINFEALASRFQQSKNKQTSVEALKAAIQGRLQTMIRTNRTRADFLQRFEELIADYNAGSRNIEQLFNDLLALSKSLDDEQGRHVREGLTDEQLVLFDILTRPAPDLTPEEEKAVKKVARSLLEAIRARLVLNWRDKQQARAGMLDSIKTTLDEGLPSGYTKELFDSKCDALFQHFYENYAERDVNVYASA